MSLSAFLAAVISAALLLCGISAWIISRKQRRDYEILAKTATFHCIRCDSVYVAPFGSESAVCPKCGYKNSRLRF